MTKIEFTDEHLQVLTTALEVYSRLRAGQIGIAMGETYPDFDLSWEEHENIEKYVREILFPKPPELKYDGHGGYCDQYGNSYGENRERDSEITYEEKIRAKRPNLGGGYFGVGHSKMLESGGTLAYEIYSTLRQFVALRRNDGYSGNTVDFNPPLELTKIPLPKIEGFSEEKRFPIRGKAVVNNLRKTQESKDWKAFWDTIGEYLSRHYPELDGYSQARAEPEDNHFVVLVKGARKKNENRHFK